MTITQDQEEVMIRITRDKSPKCCFNCRSLMPQWGNYYCEQSGSRFKYIRSYFCAYKTKDDRKRRFPYYDDQECFNVQSLEALRDKCRFYGRTSVRDFYAKA
jgi:hypothetical protein